MNNSILKNGPFSQIQSLVAVSLHGCDKVVTPHVHARAGGYVIGAGVHMFVDKKKLNRTLAIDTHLFKQLW